MFNQKVEYIDIDLTNICNARCPQCPRYDHEYRLRPGLNKNSLTVDDLVNGIDDKYWKTIRTIVHSGTTGEPTLNKQILQILEYEIAKKYNIELKFGVGGNHKESSSSDLLKRWSEYSRN